MSYEYFAAIAVVAAVSFMLGARVGFAAWVSIAACVTAGYLAGLLYVLRVMHAVRP